MDINITKLTDKEIANICFKYNIIQSNELNNYTRDQVIKEIQKWFDYKKNSYKQRRHSSPNISNASNSKTISQLPNNNLKRSNSQPINIQKTNNKITSPPDPTVNRNRRMSEPFTSQEKVEARRSFFKGNV